jgi:hypothetical protein
MAKGSASSLYIAHYLAFLGALHEIWFFLEGPRPY